MEEGGEEIKIDTSLLCGMPESSWRGTEGELTPPAIRDVVNG